MMTSLLLLLVLLVLLVLPEVVWAAFFSVDELLLIAVVLAVVLGDFGSGTESRGNGGGLSLGGAERGLRIGAELFSVLRCEPSEDGSGFLTGCAVLVLMLGLPAVFFPELLS